MVNIKLKNDSKEIYDEFIDYGKLSLYKNGILSLPHLVIRKGSNVKLEVFVDKNGSYYIRTKEGSMVREFNCKLYFNKYGLCEDIFYLEKSETREKQVGIRDEIVDFNDTHECYFYSSANNKFRSDISKRPISIEEKDKYETALIQQRRVFEFINYILEEYERAIPGIIIFLSGNSYFRKMNASRKVEVSKDYKMIVDLLFYVWYNSDFSECDGLVVRRTGRTRKRNA